MRALLQAVDRDWEEHRLYSGISSGEGIIHQVRDPIEELEQDPKSHAVHRVVKDAGVSDKRLLIVESEFAHLLKVMNREGNTVSPIVRLAWDDKPLQNTTKNSPARATGTHVSVLGHATQPDVLRYLNQTDAANGFGNRFLWVWAVRSKLLPFPSEVPALAELTERLRSLVARAREIGTVAWGEAAAPLWAAAYPRLSEGRVGLFGAVTSRAEAQVLRLATLYALLDGSAAIQPAHLLAALAVWRYCDASARYLFGDSTGDPAADAILEKVRQSPAGITRWEIRDLLQRHCSAARLNRILDRLVAEGLVRRGKRLDTGGRPAELLLPTEVALSSGGDPLDIARRLQAVLEGGMNRPGHPVPPGEFDESCDKSDESAETPMGLSSLSSLSAHPSAVFGPPPCPHAVLADEELASPWELPTDPELDRALDRAFDDPEEDEEEQPDDELFWEMDEEELTLDLRPDETEPDDEEWEETALGGAAVEGRAGWLHEEL